MSRQQLRRNRLLEQEKEQHLEDAEGLVMTEEQRRLLLSPFMSVKFEFHDLDGLRWTQTALRRRQYNHRPTVLPPSTSGRVLLAKASNSFHDVEATIRASVECLPTQLHQSPKFKKRNRHRSPITSQSFWDPDASADTVTLNFPLPPSTLPTPPLRNPNFTFFDGLGLIVAPNKHSTSGESLLSFSIHHTNDDDSFYDKVMHTRCFSTATFRRSFS